MSFLFVVVLVFVVTVVRGCGCVAGLLLSSLSWVYDCNRSWSKQRQDKGIASETIGNSKCLRRTPSSDTKITHIKKK